MNAPIVVTMAILVTYLTGNVAMRRGHAVRAWYGMGALLAPLPLLRYFFFPGRTRWRPDGAKGGTP
jgi:hypothetical protein